MRERYYKVALKRGSLLKLLAEAEVAEQVYNSNAIENSTLTLEETQKLAYLEGMEIVTLAEYAKRKKESHSNLINKAHCQTIEAFLEKGVWKIGISRFKSSIKKTK